MLSQLIFCEKVNVEVKLPEVKLLEVKLQVKLQFLKLQEVKLLEVKLQVKLQFLEKEKIVFKVFLELLKLNNSYLNSSMSQYVKNGSRSKEKNQKDSSRQISEKLDLKSSQRKDLQDYKEKIKNNKHSQVKSKKEEKKNIFIVSDSMWKNITGSGISRDHAVKIKPHPGATTVDMIDYIKPELRHKPDIIILHCGTNDITNDVNTVKKMKKLVKKIEENDGSTDIVISGLIKSFDRNVIDDIERTSTLG